MIDQLIILMFDWLQVMKNIEAILKSESATFNNGKRQLQGKLTGRVE